MLNTGNNQNKNLNPEGKSRELSPWLRRRLIQRMITPARPEGDLHRSAAPLPRNTRHTFGYSRLLTQLNSRPVLNVRDSAVMALSGSSTLLNRRSVSGPSYWRKIDLLYSRPIRRRALTASWPRLIPIRRSLSPGRFSSGLRNQRLQTILV